MLALRLLLVPAFLALLTLAGRLFGPGIAGWLAGPILLVLALENGGAELLLRMVAGALLTLAVAAAAARIGGTWSGLFALFPVLGSVLAVFSHRNSGAGHAAVLLQGMARGLLSLVAFCATAAWLLPTRPLAMAFGAAVAAGLVAQLATMRRAS